MTPTPKVNTGYVYILVSPNCQFIKIGGTDFAPLKRIKEINSSEPYKDLGPWTLHDFRQVINWRKVEYNLHYRFRSKLVKSVNNQKELFYMSPVEASNVLDNLDESMILKKPKVDRLFQDKEFTVFLMKLFKYTAILNWLDLQGAWTFSLFPLTNGGRYFTLNIGLHEVAFSTLGRKQQLPVHMIHMDQLIHDFDEIRYWLKNKNGSLIDDNYASGLYRSTSVFFNSSFDDALIFLGLKGVRRAIIAYWTEALIDLQERAALSVHSRNHNWNAVAALRRKILIESY